MRLRRKRRNRVVPESILVRANVAQMGQGVEPRDQQMLGIRPDVAANNFAPVDAQCLEKTGQGTEGKFLADQPDRRQHGRVVLVEIVRQGQTLPHARALDDFTHRAMKLNVVVKVRCVEIPMRRMEFGERINDCRAQSHFQLFNRVQCQQPDFTVEIVKRDDRTEFRPWEKIPGRRVALEVPHVDQQPVVTNGFQCVFCIASAVDYEALVPKPMQRFRVWFSNF